MGSNRNSTSSKGGRVRRKKKKCYGPDARESGDSPDNGKEATSGDVRGSASARKLSMAPSWLEGLFEEDEGLADTSNPDTSILEEENDDEEEESDSEEEEEQADGDDSTDGSRIVDLSTLQAILTAVSVCKVCQKGELKVTESERVGLGSTVTITCSTPGCKLQQTSCLTAKSANGKFYDINRRSVLAMRRIGRGHAALSKFCGLLNLPSPICERSFRRHQIALSAAARQVAEQSMLSAAEELKEQEEGNDVAVSFDGTWMRRGYSSLYGVFAAIGQRTGRIVDCHVASKYCHECMTWMKKKEDGKVTAAVYQEWQQQHNCKVNTEMSSGGMETEAAVILWGRSVDQNGLHYTTYIGDGDSKGYNAVCQSKPYDVDIVKEECVGHVQKRLGSGLRELKKNMRGQKLSDGKPLAGSGCLTDKMIDTLPTY